MTSDLYLLTAFSIILLISIYFLTNLKNIWVKRPGTGEIFAKDFELSIQSSGNYLAICDTGAYGFVMASNYNSRNLPTEILINNNNYAIIRKKENKVVIGSNSSTVKKFKKFNWKPRIYKQKLIKKIYNSRHESITTTST